MSGVYENWHYDTNKWQIQEDFFNIAGHFQNLVKYFQQVLLQALKHSQSSCSTENSWCI